MLIDPLDLLVVVLVFTPLERLLPLRPQQKILRRNWLTDATHFLVSGLLIKLGLGAILLCVLAASPYVVPPGLREAVSGLPIWIGFPAALLIGDLGFYAAHRCFHAIPWLWRFHVVHHSIEEMDWLAAHRVHPIDQILTKGASLAPLLLLGFSSEALLGFALLYRWQSVLIHSNVRIEFGPLRWLLASPRFHHWHHANAPEAIDKNFAGQLPLLDALFGTAFFPGRPPERYGLNEPVPDGYLGQIAHPFAARRAPAAAA